MHRRARALTIGLLLATFAPVADVAAQAVGAGPPRIELKLPVGSSTVLIAVRGVLNERAFDGLLRNGFPARLHIRSELWIKGRWFDELVDRRELDMIVQYDVIDRTYEVLRYTADLITPLGIFKQFGEARAATEVAFSPPLRAPVKGRKNYYSVQVEVQTIEMTDLDEVQRWLRGEARPAVQGRKNPGTALTRGIRALVSRLLGGEVRHLEQRSPVFDP